MEIYLYLHAPSKTAQNFTIFFKSCNTMFATYCCHIFYVEKSPQSCTLFTTIIEALHCNPPPVLYTLCMEGGHISVTLIVGQLLFVCKQMTPKDLKNKKRPFLNLYELFKYKLHSIPSMLNVFQPFYCLSF